MTSPILNHEGQPVEPQRHPFGRLDVEGVRLVHATPTIEIPQPREVNAWRDHAEPQATQRR